MIAHTLAGDVAPLLIDRHDIDIPVCWAVTVEGDNTILAAVAGDDSAGREVTAECGHQVLVRQLGLGLVRDDFLDRCPDVGGFLAGCHRRRVLRDVVGRRRALGGFREWRCSLWNIGFRSFTSLDRLRFPRIRHLLAVVAVVEPFFEARHVRELRQ